MITNAKEFVEEVCFEVCLEFRGAQITPTREIIRESIEYKIKSKRRSQPLLDEIDVNIDEGIAYCIGRAVAQHLDAKAVVIGFDGRVQ